MPYKNGDKCEKCGVGRTKFGHLFWDNETVMDETRQPDMVPNPPRVEDSVPCHECGEVETHKLHHDVSNPMTQDDPHFDECNYEASYEGEERGWVPSMLCHEYERGCYCGESGRCEVCVEKAVDYADHMRDVWIENGTGVAS